MVALFRRNIDVSERVRTGRTAKVVKDWMAYLKSVESVFRPLGEFIPRSAEEMSRQEKRLMQAGIRRKDGVVLFHGTQFALDLLFVFISLDFFSTSLFSFIYIFVFFI